MGLGKAKKQLTDRSIAALKPAAQGKRDLHYDALVPGLAVRCTDTGAKSFVLVGRFPGSNNPTARALGKVGVLSHDANRATLALLASTRRDGRNGREYRGCRDGERIRERSDFRTGRDRHGPWS